MAITTNNKIFILPLVSIISLSACGGDSGGGGGTTASPTSNTPTPAPTPAPPPRPPFEYNTEEFRNTTALSQINAQVAYLDYSFGNGVLVGVIDSGVTEVPELEGQLHPNSTNIVTSDPDDIDDFSGHGTAMAGIIAAKRDPISNSNPFNMHGVAFEAQILSINATNAANCPDLSNCSFFNSDIANAFDYAVANNVDVINESLGSDTLSSLNLQLAMQRAVNDDIVIVLPAGNIDADTPAGVSDSAQLSSAVAYAPWANGQIIIAGSVDSDNTISDFSYKAGTDAMNVFLVAPGRDILTIDYDVNSGYEYVQTNGTSASTAVISGAAALLIDAFPNLTAKQVADLLFSTATDLGAPGVDAIYGHGLINLEDAFSAQGQLVIAGNGFAAATQIGNTSNLSTQNLIFSGGAFGSDISFSNALDDIMVTDSYDRSFSVDFTKGIHVPTPSVNLGGYMDGAMTNRYHSLSINENMNIRMGWQYDDRFNENNRRYFSNHLGANNNVGNLRMAVSFQMSDNYIASASTGMSLAELMEDFRPDDYIAPNYHGFNALQSPNNTNAASIKTRTGKKTTMEFAYSASEQIVGENIAPQRLNIKNSIFLNRVNHQLTNKMSLSFDMGVMNEVGSVLGAVSTGVLTIGDGARTGFVGAKFDYNISPKSSFYGRATYGITDVDTVTGTLLGNISTLQSHSYLVGIKSLGLLRDDDQISLTFSQPLKLSSGNAIISNVAERNYENNSYRMSFNRVGLAPSGTERDIELSYSMANFYGARMQVNLLHQFNPGHVSSIKGATSLLLRLGSNF